MFPRMLKVISFVKVQLKLYLLKQIDFPKTLSSNSMATIILTYGRLCLCRRKILNVIMEDANED